MRGQVLWQQVLVAKPVETALKGAQEDTESVKPKIGGILDFGFGKLCVLLSSLEGCFHCFGHQRLLPQHLASCAVRKGISSCTSSVAC